MKPAAFSGMLILFIAASAHAQLTLMPQVGFDRSKTSLSVNDLSSFSPKGSMVNLKANLRMDYRFKGGHGPYVAVGTAPAPVEFSFVHPSNAVNDFIATAGKTQLKLEGGYQYSFKPIRLGTATKSAAKEVNKSEKSSSHCSSSYYRCGTKAKAKPVSTPLTMRLQPSVGLAYNPVAEENITAEGNGYQYKAGNWKTAVVSGMGFEFGKGRHRLFTVGLFYEKGLGNLDTKSISTIENTKPVITNFSSKTSSWGMTLGVPISLSKSSSHQAKKSNKSLRSHCESKSRSETKSRCVSRI